MPGSESLLIKAKTRPFAETMVELADVSKALRYYSPGTLDDKKALYEAEHRMLDHPFIANVIARAPGESLAQLDSRQCRSA